MNINKIIGFVIVALVVLLGAQWYVKNNDLPEISLEADEQVVVSEESEQEGEDQPNILTMDNGLQIEDVKVGEGAEVKVGDNITVHYVGALTDGTVFDSSRERGTPATFGLNPGGLIEGWIQGIPGMKVGGVRKLVIPSELGYGAAGAGASIPPNATLLFEVELVDIK